MYYYIVNPAAGSGTINGIQDKLKATLHGLKIDGEFAKTLGEGDAQKITKNALAKGAKTIVAVGGDKTINEIITAVHESGNSAAAIGIIPIGHNNTLANLLGIKSWQQACEVLSARRLREFNLMTLNSHAFIHSCRIVPKANDSNRAEAFSYLSEIDGNYRMRGETSEIIAYNQKMLNPHLDNELIIRVHSLPEKAGIIKRLYRSAKSQDATPEYTQAHAKSIVLECKSSVIATIDGSEVNGKKFVIKLDHRPVRLITGRDLNHRGLTG